MLHHHIRRLVNLTAVILVAVTLAWAAART